MESKARVLVVDDENVVCTSFHRILSEDGYAVDTVLDGGAALDRIQRQPFDVAFVDLRMPGLDGMEVVRRIRRSRPEIQIVIVTGYGTPEAQKEAAALGVLEFLSKPVTPETITRAAGCAWEKRRRIPQEAFSAAAAAPAEAPAPRPAGPPPEEPKPSVLKTAGMLAGGSLLGLVYVIFLPAIGVGLLGWILAKKAYAALVDGGPGGIEREGERRQRGDIPS